MKRLLLTALVICSAQFLSGQYCGVSDTSQCTSPGLLTSSGFEPANQVPPVINDSTTNIVIEYLGGDTITFNNQTLVADSTTLDTIYDLPPGLCWSTNKPRNTFGRREDGCIKISGVTCTAPGQYNPNVIMKLYLTVPIPVSARTAIILRVINSGENLPAVDTTGMAEDSMRSYIFYGPSASCWPLGISTSFENNITTKAWPNPLTDVTNIDVTGLNQPFDFELFDLTGRLQQTTSSIASNRLTVHKGALANGVYLYHIVAEGNPVAFGKLIIQ